MMVRVWVLIAMLTVLAACESQQDIDLEEYRVVVAVQLDAVAEKSALAFDPSDSASYQLKSHFVIEDSELNGYLLWLYFARDGINQWQTIAVYEEQVVASYQLHFSPSGRVDAVATAEANASAADNLFRFPFDSPEGSTIHVVMDMGAVTQYGLGSESYYISKPEEIPYIYREEPSETSYFDLSMKVDDRVMLKSYALFNPDDIATYNHAAVGQVYDSMGVQHWLYFFFTRESQSSWWLSVFVKDALESFPDDGWAELVAGESEFLLTFDLAGQLIRINGAPLSVGSALPEPAWSLESGATGRSGEDFSFRLGIHQIMQWSGDYIGEADQDGGWYQ